MREPGQSTIYGHPEKITRRFIEWLLEATLERFVLSRAASTIVIRTLN